MISPFQQYEKRFCEECDDYNGCIGLLLKASLESSEISEEFIKEGGRGDKVLMDMVKNIGASVFTQKYGIIVNCMRAREFMGKGGT